ncbi:hypothetical protein BD410DRAFT_781388 [Rickenella mellea]|uniref:Uncharacterized protein n=1 Tax=Rickenella mellea TaxID=50990 RepID=A0A4Y7QMF2_9AGAM|nr:hypothetical protein BD410DRAFT_781388 [Rickenella mellea]
MTSVIPPARHHAHCPPSVSSPLASNTSAKPAPSLQVTIPQRSPSFPPSRPLRPFPSISSSIEQPKSTPLGVQNQNRVDPAGGKKKQQNGGGQKPVKLIEPPQDFKASFFVLNLTQAEFSRQD